jgi:hypothetical protein
MIELAELLATRGPCRDSPFGGVGQGRETAIRRIDDDRAARRPVDPEHGEPGLAPGSGATLITCVLLDRGRGVLSELAGVGPQPFQRRLRCIGPIALQVGLGRSRTEDDAQAQRNGRADVTGKTRAGVHVSFIGKMEWRL